MVDFRPLGKGTNSNTMLGEELKLSGINYQEHVMFRSSFVVQGHRRNLVLTASRIQNTKTGLGGAVAKSLAVRLVGPEFQSRYRLQLRVRSTDRNILFSRINS